VIKRYTNFGGAIVCVLRADTGVEGAIHCGNELWFGVGMEVLERDQNLVLHTEGNGPEAHNKNYGIELPLRTDRLCSKLQ